MRLHLDLSNLVHDRHTDHVWRSTEFERILFSSDLLGHSTTLMLIAAVVARLQEHLPEDQELHDVRLGPHKLPLSMPLTFLCYGGISTAALVLLLCQPRTYFRHRMSMCMAVRAVRLLVQLFTMLTPSAAVPLAGALAARLQANPQKATAMLLIQPLVYYLQPAMLLLPWRHVLLVQMVSTAAMLHWLWLLPCVLQQQLGAPLWEPSAGVLCTKLQSLVALFRTAAGGNLSELSHSACDGMVGVQSMQVFVNLVFLLGMPVLLVFWLERWVAGRRNQQPGTNGISSSTNSSSHAGEAAPTVNAAVSPQAGGTSSSNMGSSSNSSSAGNSSAFNRSTGDSSRVRQETTSTAQYLASLAEAGAEAGSACRHVMILALLALLALPMLWLMSEFVAEVFEAHRDCTAVLAIVHG